MKQENAIIDKVRKYIAKCPYLKEYAELNVEYLQDKVNTYSINENAGYDPIINKFFVGAEMQFLFTFDSKLAWNEDIQNSFLKILKIGWKKKRKIKNFLKYQDAMILVLIQMVIYLQQMQMKLFIEYNVI